MPGTLWEGRYKATLIDSEHYLLTGMCHIELNPVRAGMVNHPGNYPYSTTNTMRARLHVPDPRPLRDGLVAATALVHGMTVVRGNLTDFELPGVPLLNPWDSLG